MNNESHENWMKEQVELAVKKADSGGATFIPGQDVKQLMKSRREEIRKSREPMFGVLCGGGKDDNP